LIVHYPKLEGVPKMVPLLVQKMSFGRPDILNCAVSNCEILNFCS
jgi:hypothetical protein